MAARAATRRFLMRKYWQRAGTRSRFMASNPPLCVLPGKARDPHVRIPRFAREDRAAFSRRGVPSVTRTTRALLSLALLFVALPVVAQTVQQTGAPNASAATPDPTRKKALSID